jgi:hypothetical protein
MWMDPEVGGAVVGARRIAHDERAQTGGWIFKRWPKLFAWDALTLSTIFAALRNEGPSVGSPRRSHFLDSRRWFMVRVGGTH